MYSCFWQALDGLCVCIDPVYFPGRAATIYYRAAPAKSGGTLSTIKNDVERALHIKKDVEIGSLGILHPSVLAKFEIGYPCSALEFTLEPFKKAMSKVWTNEE